MKKDMKTLSKDECLRLLKKYDCPERVIRHSLKVSEIALKKNYQLISPFDDDIITCAALLHDIMRPQPDHAEAGAKLLKELGYEEIAEIIASHHDLEDENFDERHLIYLADKLVREDKEVSLEERFLTKLAQFDAEEAKAACLRRYRQALRIQELFERKCRQ